MAPKETPDPSQNAAADEGNLARVGLEIVKIVKGDMNFR
jgi:hypothetical protein